MREIKFKKGIDTIHVPFMADREILEKMEEEFRHYIAKNGMPKGTNGVEIVYKIYRGKPADYQLSEINYIK